ncbi:MAG: hypothetical protein KY429_02530 [Actinobacteria bacterium]|nr:hypothetical protein [Actinomycetota bacterium]
MLALMLASYLVFFHILLTGPFLGEPSRRSYLQAAAVAGFGGIALAAPMLVIGILRKQRSWKLAALFLVIIGLAIAGFDLFEAVSTPPRIVPPR